MAERGRRVSFLITTLQVGGAETQLLRVSRELVRRGWTVSVLSLRGGAELEQQFTSAGVRVVRLTPDVMKAPGLRTVLNLVMEVRASRPECLITLLFQANVLGKIVGALCRVPVVSSIRNVKFGGGSRVGGVIADLLERVTRPFAYATVVNSELAARQLAERGIVNPSTVRVLVNALPDSGDAPSAEQLRLLRVESGLSETKGAEEFLWLSAGRLERQKNFGALVEAFHQLHLEHPGARLLIAGEGRDRPALESQISALSLEGVVTLLGLRDDLEQLLTLADGFVLASCWEGLPNVVLEAMQAGVPTVATDVGGVADLIRDGRTGWLIADTTPVAIGRGLAEVMETDPDLRSTIAKSGRAFVAAGFSLDGVVDTWAALINEAADSRKATRR